MIVVRSQIVHSLFVIDTRYDRSVAMHPDLHLGNVRQLHMRGRTRAVAQVTCFAVGAAILERNHEVLIQDSRKNLDLPLLVAIQHFEFKGSNFASSGWFLRSSREVR